VLSYLSTDEDRIVRDIITLPLRIGVCATRVGVRLTGRAVTRALRATWGLIGSPLAQGLHGAGEGDGQIERVLAADVVILSQPPRRETPSAPRPAPPDAQHAIGWSALGVPARTETAHVSNGAAVAETSTAAPVPEFQPAHVSERLQFVEAFAEPGAEEGAGASVHVEEPWKGYARMRADEVIARLDDASSAGLATVTLYERSHRRRRTVLAAADRQLQHATAVARQSR
jgi:hypothetical protein